MALLDKLPGKKGDKKGRKVSKRSLPTKRSINLATTGEKPIQLTVAIPAIVLIVLAAGLLSKFAVVDRLLAVSKAQSEVAQLQSQLDASYQALGQFGELSDAYAHYTTSGMTSEELNRTDRVAVVDLIQRVVLPQSWVSTWSLNGNTLTLDITRGDLQEINLTLQQLNAEPLVDFCTVTTASTTNTTAEQGRAESTLDSTVTGQIVIYLINGSPEEQTGESTGTEGEQSDLEKAIDKTSNTVSALADAKEQAEQMGGEG